MKEATEASIKEVLYTNRVSATIRSYVRGCLVLRVFGEEWKKPETREALNHLLNERFNLKPTGVCESKSVLWNQYTALYKYGQEAV